MFFHLSIACGLIKTCENCVILIKRHFPKIAKINTQKKKQFFTTAKYKESPINSRKHLVPYGICTFLEESVYFEIQFILAVLPNILIIPKYFNVWQVTSRNH